MLSFRVKCNGSGNNRYDIRNNKSRGLPSHKTCGEIMETLLFIGIVTATVLLLRYGRTIIEFIKPNIMN